MNGIIKSTVFIFLLFLAKETFPQCQPVDCLDKLPDWGGICDSSLLVGEVNSQYEDYLSFSVTNGCVDANTLNLWYKAVSAKVLKVHSLNFSKLPDGLTCTPNENEYTPPANGCGKISGKPLEAGCFDATITFLANVKAWPFSPSCSGFITINVNDVVVKASLTLVILPDPGFTLSDSIFCVLDSPVKLIPSGTIGGKFTGPGVNGDNFDPSLAGAGVHQIRYDVSAQEGAAFAPASNYSVVEVQVLPASVYFADKDNDNFISDTDSTISCTQPPRFIIREIASGLDCNDSDSLINPFSTDIPGNNIDEDCSGADSLKVSSIKYSEGELSIYPNPFSGTFQINGLQGESLISLYDQNGKLLFSREIKSDDKVDLDMIPDGNYILRIENTGRHFYRKIIKKE